MIFFVDLSFFWKSLIIFRDRPELRPIPILRRAPQPVDEQDQAPPALLPPMPRLQRAPNAPIPLTGKLPTRWFNLTPTPSLWTAAVHCPFMSFFRPFHIIECSRGKIVIPLSYIFTTFIFLKISGFTWLDWEKNLFSLAVLRISPKNRIQAA